MKFEENLREVRKQHGLSQEELADRLAVSRQAVSKWENGSAYPEVDKIMALCTMFDCTMDELLQGDLKEKSGVSKGVYNAHQNRYSLAMSICTVLIILGCSLYCYMEPRLQASKENFLNLTILIPALIAVAGYIYFGMLDSSFKRRYPKAPLHIYNEDEIYAFDKKYRLSMVLGIVILLIGTFIQPLLEDMRGEEIANGTFLLFVAIGVSILVYMGLMKTKYDKTDPKTYTNGEEDSKTDKWYGVIMLLATAVYLGWSFLWNAWEISWIVFVFGGILCGIVWVIFHNEKDDES